MTVPSVRLLGDWPHVPQGFSALPPSVARDFPGSPEAFAMYAYIVTIGYAQDGLSPLPEAIAAADPRLSLRAVKAAFADLCVRRLIHLVPEGPTGRIAEVVLPWPEADR